MKRSSFPRRRVGLLPGKANSLLRLDNPIYVCEQSINASKSQLTPLGFLVQITSMIAALWSAMRDTGHPSNHASILESAAHSAARLSRLSERDMHNSLRASGLGELIEPLAI